MTQSHRFAGICFPTFAKCAERGDVFLPGWHPSCMFKSSSSDLQNLIGYRFRNPELLLEALTHSSYAREASGSVKDNEQLEFLGDAVLNFVVSFKLADAFPGHSEGNLSRARARLVSAEHLNVVASSLNLGSYLQLGHGEEKTGGRTKSRLIVNALESLIAALYRDGGLPVAERFIARFVLPVDLEEREGQLFSVDYKSALQERLQAAQQAVAAYRVVSEKGPEHRKTFVVEVSTPGAAARGSGESKKVAEQEAARSMIEILERKRSSDG